MLLCPRVTESHVAARILNLFFMRLPRFARNGHKGEIATLDTEKGPGPFLYWGLSPIYLSNDSEAGIDDHRSFAFLQSEDRVEVHLADLGEI